MSLQRALLLLIATALLAGIVPGGVLIDRRLAREVEARARNDLAQAPQLQRDRLLAQADAMLMHARDVARASHLADALIRGARTTAVRAAESARGDFGDAAVVVGADGEVWNGPMPSPPVLDHVLEAVRRGETPTVVVADSAKLYLVTLVSVERSNVWVGAAGISVAIDNAAAAALAAFTRSDVLFLGDSGALVAATTNDSVTAALVRHSARMQHDGSVHLIAIGQRQYLITSVPAGDVGTTVFARDFTRDLAVLPVFRSIIVISGIAAVILGLLLGTVVARRIARPVMALADAADRLTAGDAEAPLMRSSIREIDRLSDAFIAMRQTLALRISDVTGLNRRLTDRQTRFETSQSEILQRERLAVSSRLVAELAHEIRNPIANLRNCLEVIRRRVGDDSQGLEFTDLAIDELLRMHELAEQLLDLNRPRDPAVRTARVHACLHEISVLTSAGSMANVLKIVIEKPTGAEVVAAIAPDALKQVLLNLVQNAREALSEQTRETNTPGVITLSAHAENSRITISVFDNGPGISPDVMPHVFDPFFTTKGAVHGVGLGLFVADGLVRTAGGRITVANFENSGARFEVELPQSEDNAA
ncbi:MAG: HAMP domain-containing sensor histidine kinase [Gemmatimonadaceae bacterium]